MSATVTLPADEIHLWHSGLNLSTTVVAHWHTVLSPDEQQRADRFHFESDRQRFIVGRGMLRDVLGRYLDLPPAAVPLTYSARGKPALATPDAGVQFNLSHSHGEAVLAVVRGRNIGVDIEKIRPAAADDSLARRYFSPPEVEALRATPPEAYATAFFRCWTRKEAYLKARGDGLQFALDKFAVTLDDQPRLVWVDGDDEELTRWTLVEIVAPPECAGALAVSGSSCRLRYFGWRHA